MPDFPESGKFSIADLNVVLGYPAGRQTKLSESDVRVRLMKREANTEIRLAADSYRKTLHITSITPNGNLRSIATGNGWNSSTKLEFVIDGNGAGTYGFYSTSSGTPALIVNGTYPNGLFLNNYGYIIGKGGDGGAGGSPANSSSDGGPGSSGIGGGIAAYFDSPSKIYVWNIPSPGLGGVLGGGGGGGGGGTGGRQLYVEGKNSATQGGLGGGGGGGLSTNPSPSAGGAAGVNNGGTGWINGTAGGASNTDPQNPTPGVGGTGGFINSNNYGGNGGIGGGRGSAGISGNTGVGGAYYGGGSGGGAGGSFVNFGGTTPTATRFFYSIGNVAGPIS
jgi:hypothetical protein